jgi:hypothetical protein
MNALNEDLLIIDTEVSTVYDALGGLTYNVYSKLFDKTVICKMYTDCLDLTSEDGYISIHFKNKRNTDVWPVGRPYHYLKDNVLYVLKNNKQKTINGFALNHELFALEWDVCFILHPHENSGSLFTCSKEQWLKEGFATQQNRELQVYMEIPNYKGLPLTVLPDGGKKWLILALIEMEKKRQ